MFSVYPFHLQFLCISLHFLFFSCGICFIFKEKQGIVKIFELSVKLVLFALSLLVYIICAVALSCKLLKCNVLFQTLCLRIIVLLENWEICWLIPHKFCFETDVAMLWYDCCVVLTFALVFICTVYMLRHSFLMYCELIAV